MILFSFSSRVVCDVSWHSPNRIPVCYPRVWDFSFPSIMLVYVGLFLDVLRQCLELNWRIFLSHCQPDTGCFSVPGISTTVRKLSLPFQEMVMGIFSSQQGLHWSEMTQHFCITSKSIEHLLFRSRERSGLINMCIWRGKRKKKRKKYISRLMTAVVSFDLLQ